MEYIKMAGATGRHLAVDHSMVGWHDIRMRWGNVEVCTLWV